jgi:predicted RNA-binding protein with PIN domain
MPYLIDGHNLIPKIHSLNLKALDDEIELVKMLLLFCQRKRKHVEVFFDNAPPGQPRARNFGAVTAHFIRQESTADNAIRQRLGRLGHDARNWIVVSSDRSVQTAARAAKARSLRSEDFANQLDEILVKTDQAPDLESGKILSDDEIKDWLRLFKSKPTTKK